MAGAGRHGHELLPVPGHDVPARELVGATERLAKLPPGDLAGVPPVQAAEAHPVEVELPRRVGRVDTRRTIVDKFVDNLAGARFALFVHCGSVQRHAAPRQHATLRVDLRQSRSQCASRPAWH